MAVSDRMLKCCPAYGTGLSEMHSLQGSRQLANWHYAVPCTIAGGRAWDAKANPRRDKGSLVSMASREDIRSEELSSEGAMHRKVSGVPQVWVCSH